jgi:hypothetical protein
MSNGTNTVSELLEPELMTESSTMPPSLAMSEHSSVKGTPQAIRDWLTCLPVDSLVSPSALPESVPEPMTSETCGQQHGIASALFDLASASLKTFQACLLADISEPSLEIWPKAGIVCAGAFYPQPKWERRISEIDYGLLPTIGKNEFRGAGKKRYMGSDEFRGAKMAEGLRHNESDPFYLHPDFAEAAMMWPIMWTALAPLEMDKFQQWLQQHGIYSVRD